jgi:hypothetical protein
VNKSESTQEIQKITLTGKLEEFRKALEEEIKSARANAYGQAISLVSGRKISEIGNSFQYSFRLENPLNLPIDTPGELHIPNRKPADIIIVSVEGVLVIVSSREDLGDYVSSARLISDLTFLMRKLIERIEELGESDNIVGDRILKNVFSYGKFVSTIYPSSEEENAPNRKQEESLESSLRNNLTYIWGPPGTGKTRTIGSIGYQLQKNQRSLLIVSHTNTAVDQALINIAKQTSQALIDQGKILRVGEARDPRLNEDFPNTRLEIHVERRSQELFGQLEMLRNELSSCRDEVQKLTGDIELYDWFIDAKTDLEQMRSDNNGLMEMERELSDHRKYYVELKQQSSYWEEAKSYADGTNGKVIELVQVEIEINEARAELDKCLSKKERITFNLHTAQKILDETSSVNWITRSWRGLPSPDQQEKIVVDLEKQLSRSENHQDRISSEFNLLITISDRLKEEIVKFRKMYSSSPDDILSQEKKYQDELNRLVETGTALRNKCNQYRAKNYSLFRERLLFLQDLGYGKAYQGSPEKMFSQIEDAFEEIENVVKVIDIEKCRSSLQRTLKQIEDLEVEILRIEELLSRIEETVISEADIVATTLTRAYLRDSIRSRKFDSIIIDEASMAPIPAIWVASSIIENNAVVVGDPRQLPPIVSSTHELAEKWLGKDVFSVSEVMTEEPENLIQLQDQYRMHPAITAIPNQFFYKFDKKLNDARTEEPVEPISQWYQENWGYDSPVILVDTGPINAWVTSVSRGNTSSRLNFLSAVLCVNLCKVLLKEDRPDRGKNEDLRIIIQSPYNPHAKLLDLLLREFNLENDVKAGTVHAFQGSEATVVIYDLVNDEPHWRVGLFMPQNDDSTERLVNVSVTRAKERLIIVGDFSYNEKLAKKAFLGREFIPFLRENYPIYSARDIVSLDLLDQADKARNLISRGQLDRSFNHLVVTQDDFYQFLFGDLYAARSRIVIYSPFITENRIAELQAGLFSAISRGVQIYVVTKSLQERGKRAKEQYRYIESSLEEWGVTIIHKRNMHEKLIIIDDDVLWSGSLNPMSYSNTQEIMERRVSKKLVEEYCRIARVNELVGEFSDGVPKCPVCESEMVASEGKDDPYYWRCVVDGCYSRSIDQPPIKGGIIVCMNCGGKVEYGEWGNNPAWRCTENRRHHQKIVKTHLRLPKMREIIPFDELLKLDRMFNIPFGEKH